MRAATLLARARPYRKALAGIGLLSVAGSLLTLAIPWLAGNVLGGVLADGANAVMTSVALLAAVLVGTTALTVAGTILSAATSGRIVADLRLSAHSHVHRLPMQFHDRANAGELLSLTVFEVMSLAEFLSGTLARLPATVLTAGGAALLLYRLEPMAGLLILALLPLGWIAVKMAGRRLRLLGEQARNAETALVVLAEQQLEMLPATRAFAQEQRQRDLFRGQAQESRRLQLAQARVKAVLGPAISLVSALAAVALILLVGEAAAIGDDPGALFTVLLYAALLTRPVGALADLYGQYQWAGGTLARLETVMDEEEEPGLSAAPVRTRASGAIAFEDVSFAYPGREHTLEHVSLAIRPGEIVALTGENGAGKSTLIALLLRFYDPGSGRITLDGADIAGIQVQDLRRQIGLVPQRPLLFDGTVRDNIVFGRPHASEAEIAAALSLAQADKLVALLPQGLETAIGDHGVRLSGGQRQRIALARALLGDPPVLVFDEATSMFDLEAEAAFVAACRDGLRGRTVLLVTHRPASLALADRIVDFDSGRIVSITSRN